MKSEVAQLRKQLDEEYEAMQRGLNGIAVGTARHAIIQARMGRIGACHEKLTHLVGAEQAIAITYASYASHVEVQR